ncbi:hypothetical protein GY45DRAFT_1215509, partial [Cubamyces sp. BRFM 1775]
DARVSALVDTAVAAEGRPWARLLHGCSKGARHGYQASYGQKQWEHVGYVFEQLKPESRLKLLHELSRLVPPPYQRPVFQAEAIMWAGILRDEIEVADRRTTSASRRQAAKELDREQRLSNINVRPRDQAGNHRPRSADSVSSDRNERSSVGRPVNPSCEVLVYVYVPGRVLPLFIRAVGTPRDNVVEFLFGQDAVYGSLGIDAKSRTKPSYMFWNREARGWTLYPKPHQPMFLLPGERLLYKDAYVSHLERLDYYKSQLLPADRERADTRYGRPLVGVPSSP